MVVKVPFFYILLYIYSNESEAIALLFFCSQHGAKLPLSNKVEGSENIEFLLYHAFCGETFCFMATFFFFFGNSI